MDYLIELNSNYFFSNIEIIKQISNCIIAPVLKSNAYGHGMREIITLLNINNSIEYICVCYTHEALKAKHDGWGKKILIMSASSDLIEIDNQYQYFVYSFDFLFLLNRPKRVRS